MRQIGWVKERRISGCPYSKLRSQSNPGISAAFRVLSRDRSGRRNGCAGRSVWLLCLADEAAEGTNEERRRLVGEGAGELPRERPDLRRAACLARRARRWSVMRTASDRAADAPPNCCCRKDFGKRLAGVHSTCPLMFSTPSFAIWIDGRQLAPFQNDDAMAEAATTGDPVSYDRRIHLI